ncbi:MAG: DUF92 domain-containing protein [bacterium]
MDLILASLVLVAGIYLFVALRLLTIPGALAAASMAILLFAAWGFAALVPALTFLIFSSLWTRWPGGAKGHERRRNLVQVLANGLPATLLAIIEIVYHNGLWGLMMSASFAAAAADTWSTEWGRPLGGNPVSLRTVRTAPPGESGAISALGTLASMAGAASVALSAKFAGILDNCDTWTVLYAGLFGGIADSLAGAWIQGQWISASGTRTEVRLDAGANGQLARGVTWVDNNAVNLLAAGTGALVALLIHIVWPD